MTLSLEKSMSVCMTDESWMLIKTAVGSGWY